ncbi:hypothetical protein [uncultured Gammaproteobacteria bacterium]|uniref:DUF1127 domain-containing protein n=1 Tax=Bathymodiolus heckerae thiotrophic gill symbiont TaxID=1052212 RepID=UPI0010BB31C3|nr:DUF1127 domain-containing protein [Bathymodiolus heckerae thiotrophic gill symbiont]CAC9438525.1 hypothetical protein [uncultured Gammaproteobacteria bacterium]SMN13904.1 hypothetical protein BHECKSOX2_1134 [Bathymodiolus heckerae thiotrophic gill symbiont]
MNYSTQKYTLACQRSNKFKCFSMTLYRAILSISQLLKMIKKYHAISKQRKELLYLTDRQLADIGINREEAIREASKPFWQ